MIWHTIQLLTADTLYWTSNFHLVRLNTSNSAHLVSEGYTKLAFSSLNHWATVSFATYLPLVVLLIIGKRVASRYLAMYLIFRICLCMIALIDSFYESHTKCQAGSSSWFSQLCCCSCWCVPLGHTFAHSDDVALRSFNLELWKQSVISAITFFEMCRDTKSIPNLFFCRVLFLNESINWLCNMSWLLKCYMLIGWW